MYIYCFIYLIDNYRVSDESGELTIEEASVHPLKKEDLDTNDAFILDTGPSGVFSWIGKGCTKNEKNAAMSNAMVGDAIHLTQGF